MSRALYQTKKAPAQIARGRIKEHKRERVNYEEICNYQLIQTTI